MTVKIKLNNVQKDTLSFETIDYLRPYVASYEGIECVVIKVTTDYGRDRDTCLYLRCGYAPMWHSNPDSLKIIRPLSPEESIIIYGNRY